MKKLNYYEWNNVSQILYFSYSQLDKLVSKGMELYIPKTKDFKHVLLNAYILDAAYMYQSSNQLSAP